MVPPESFMPLASSSSPTLANNAAPSWCFSNRWRKLSSVVASGARSRPQIDAAEIAEGSDIVERIFASFIAQVKPIGQHVHTQHALHSHRRAPVSRLGILAFDHGAKLRPRHQHFHACEKLPLARG